MIQFVRNTEKVSVSQAHAYFMERDMWALEPELFEEQMYVRKQYQYASPVCVISMRHQYASSTFTHASGISTRHRYIRTQAGWLRAQANHRHIDHLNACIAPAQSKRVCACRTGPMQLFRSLCF